MTDPSAIRDHVEGLSTSDLWSYLRLAMQNGDTTRSAIADEEITRRRNQ